MPLTTSMKELTKERLKIRASDPLKANVYLLLVNAVKQMTIDERRDEKPEDFWKAAKKMKAELEGTIEDYKKGNADTSELEAQIKILQPFLPEQMSPEAMEEAVKKVLAELPEDQRVLKNIMPKLKAIEGFDMKEAKNLVEKLTAK